MSEIKFLLQEMRFDILGLTESHLNNNTDNGQLSVGGCNLVRKDRTCDNSWGGCVMYYKQCLNVIQRVDIRGISSKYDLEQVWIELILACQRLLLGTLYRPPTDNQFF